MENNVEEILNEIQGQAEKNTKRVIRSNEHYLAYSLATMTILSSIFILIHTGYLNNGQTFLIAPFIERGIAFFMLVSGAIKVIAIKKDNRRLKKISILMLSFIWGGFGSFSFYLQFWDRLPFFTIYFCRARLIGLHKVELARVL